jgi:hypothetical protein
MTTPQDPRSIDAIIDSLDGGAAFPAHLHGDGYSGMTLRDYFAAAALPALLTQLGNLDKEAARSEVKSDNLSWHEWIKATDADTIISKYDVAAFGAYIVADAMLAARNAKP